MKLVEVNLQELSYTETYKIRCKLWKTVDEFMQSGMQAAQVAYDPNEYKNPNSLRSSLERAAKRVKAPCRVFTKNKKVYMVRKDAVEEMNGNVK